MAVVYSTALKTARMQLVADQISGGSLVIGTSALSGATGVLVSIGPLSAPSVAGDTLTLTGSMSGTAAAGGTAAKAEFRDSGGTVIVSGLTVALSGGNIAIGNTTIAGGQTVTVSSGALRHA